MPFGEVHNSPTSELCTFAYIRNKMPYHCHDDAKLGERGSDSKTSWIAWVPRKLESIAIDKKIVIYFFSHHLSIVIDNIVRGTRAVSEWMPRSAKRNAEAEQDLTADSQTKFSSIYWNSAFCSILGRNVELLQDYSGLAGPLDALQWISVDWTVDLTSMTLLMSLWLEATAR